MNIEKKLNLLLLQTFKYCILNIYLKVDHFAEQNTYLQMASDLAAQREVRVPSLSDSVPDPDPPDLHAFGSLGS